MPTRIDEEEMASIVKRILARRRGKAATYAELRDAIPRRLLSKADRKKSLTRPGEEMWMQIVRNLFCHEREDFEWVEDGLRLRSPTAPQGASRAGRPKTRRAA